MSAGGIGDTPDGACANVLAALVEDAERADADPTLAAHLGSCLDCFRALTELRDAPRITELLRRSEAAPGADLDPAFWDALAARTTQAAAAMMAPTAPAPARPAARSNRFAPARHRIGAALLGAAAAAVLFGTLGRRILDAPPGSARPEGPAVDIAQESSVSGLAAGLDGVVGTGDVAALEEPELRRLLDALRSNEPGEVRALYEGSAEDEGGMADELAGLDGPALRRLARALAGNSL